MTAHTKPRWRQLCVMLTCPACFTPCRLVGLTAWGSEAAHLIAATRAAVGLTGGGEDDEVKRRLVKPVSTSGVKIGLLSASRGGAVLNLAEPGQEPMWSYSVHAGMGAMPIRRCCLISSWTYAASPKNTYPAWQKNRKLLRPALSDWKSYLPACACSRPIRKCRSSSRIYGPRYADPAKRLCRILKTQRVTMSAPNLICVDSARIEESFHRTIPAGQTVLDEAS